MTTEPESSVNEPVAEDSGHTVLIVDDNPTNLGVLSNYLKEYGFRILVARSGESALKRLEYVQSDIILLDVMMPGLNGFETCERLKANEATKNIPVIFMTALAEAEDKVKGFKAGAVDYVTKPLQHEEVLVRVNTHLRIRDLTESLKGQNEVLSKRAIQLETSSQVGKQVTSILDLDELSKEVVQLIRAKFGYYFVGIWLLNAQMDIISLQSSAISGQGHSLIQDLHLHMDTDNSIITWVCHQGEPYLAEDVTIDPKYLALAELPDTHSELSLPLRVGPKIIGVLDIQSNQKAAFGEEDKVVLQTLADQIGIAIRNAQLYKSEQQRRQLAESLEQTGRVLSSDLDLRLVPGRILELLIDVVPYSRGSVMILKGNELLTIAHMGFPVDERVKNMHMQVRQGDVFQRMGETHRPVLVDDVAADPGWKQVEWLPLDHSWLGVPLISKDRVIGMISLTRHEAKAFSPNEATLVLAFAGQAAIALENAGLYEEIKSLNEHLEQKVAERTAELHKAYHVLEQLDKTKVDFIKVTSHELRTPLTAIRGNIQVLQFLLKSKDDGNISELFDSVVSGVDRLHRIVNTMLDVVKIDTQVLEMHPKPTTVGPIVEKVYKEFSADLKERQLTLTRVGLENLPVIQADKELLYKVFYNLIVNAIKYTPDGKTITINGQLIEQNNVPSVEIIVSDTGIGINPEHHQQIFEKFYQTGEVALHSSGLTKFKGGGPGLGLAIVRGIVLAHHGKVWVESEGHNEETCPGSHFHVVLPLESVTH